MRVRACHHGGCFDECRQLGKVGEEEVTERLGWRELNPRGFAEALEGVMAEAKEERLESAVIEAAVKYRETGGYLCVETNDAQRGLFAAVDALCEARSETKGSSQDALTSEDREHVPCEGWKHEPCLTCQGRGVLFDRLGKYGANHPYCSSCNGRGFHYVPREESK